MNQKVRRFGNVIGTLLALAALAYIVALMSAKLEWGGSSPDQQKLGSVLDTSQREMEQFCTGVIVTQQATWLVGRLEATLQDFEYARAVPNLAELVQPSKKEAEDSASPGVFGQLLGYKSEPKLTFISRLDHEGKFQLVAVVPEIVCLQATPDGKRVFLLTGLDQPENSEESVSSQSVIFQSDDQGKTWQWRKKGLFAGANSNAWSLRPYFYDAQSVWTWNGAQSLEDVAEGSDQVPSGLQYSPDGGSTVEEVMTAEPLRETLNMIKQQLGGQFRWGDQSGEDEGDVTQHVVQLGPDKAVLWISQRFRYALGDGLKQTHRLTRVAQMKREKGVWRIGKVKKIDGVTIKEVIDNHAGRVVGLLDRGDGLKVALLNHESLEWDVQGALPSAFGSLPGFNGTRGMYVSKNVIVANVTSDHQVPRWIYPWGRNEASISADAVFYSKNWGQSWGRLSIRGYLGVLGIDGARDRVIWAKGNSYESNDLAVYSYGLR